jgi:hypothetical protein
MKKKTRGKTEAVMPPRDQCLLDGMRSKSTPNTTPHGIDKMQLFRMGMAVLVIMASLSQIVFAFSPRIFQATLQTCQKLNSCFPRNTSYKYLHSVLDTFDIVAEKGGETPSNVSAVFHLHIQKAGGTALSVGLSSICKCPKPKQRHFKPKECKCPKKMARNGENMPIMHSRLTTAWPCGVHPWLDEVHSCGILHNLTIGGVNDDVAIVTFLRDPIQRSLSEYRQCGYSGHCWDWETTSLGSTQKHLSLAAYVEMDNSYAFQNRQMKMISGCPRKTNWTDKSTCNACLESAKKNIQLFAIVGLSEAFVPSWTLPEQ